MNWRQLLGLKPSEADFAQELIQTAVKNKGASWTYDADSSSLVSGTRTINLANIYLEYARAGWLARPSLLTKYRAMVAPVAENKVAELWTVAQTRIFPLLRSRHERMTIEIKSRSSSGGSIPPRAAKCFLADLDIVIGYDFGQTVSQVTSQTASTWGLSLDEIIDRARANLRALASPTWQCVGDAVWKLDSVEGYTESFLQLSKVFETLPAKGVPHAMIPNRGVLLATGSDEQDGLTQLLTLATQSLRESPWPLCGELFRVLPTGVETAALTGTDAQLLATIKRIDATGIYDAQKTALQSHYGDDVYVATYGIIGKRRIATAKRNRGAPGAKAFPRFCRLRT